MCGGIASYQGNIIFTQNYSEYNPQSAPIDFIILHVWKYILEIPSMRDQLQVMYNQYTKVIKFNGHHFPVLQSGSRLQSYFRAPTSTPSDTSELILWAREHNLKVMVQDAWRHFMHLLIDTNRRRKYLHFGFSSQVDVHDHDSTAKHYYDPATVNRNTSPADEDTSQLKILCNKWLDIKSAKSRAILLNGNDIEVKYRVLYKHGHIFAQDKSREAVIDRFVHKIMQPKSKIHAGNWVEHILLKASCLVCHIIKSRSFFHGVGLDFKYNAHHPLEPIKDLQVVGVCTSCLESEEGKDQHRAIMLRYGQVTSNASSSESDNSYTPSYDDIPRVVSVRQTRQTKKAPQIMDTTDKVCLNLLEAFDKVRSTSNSVNKVCMEEER